MPIIQHPTVITDILKNQTLILSRLRGQLQFSTSISTLDLLSKAAKGLESILQKAAPKLIASNDKDCSFITQLYLTALQFELYVTNIKETESKKDDIENIREILTDCLLNFNTIKHLSKISVSHHNLSFYSQLLRNTEYLLSPLTKGNPVTRSLLVIAMLTLQLLPETISTPITLLSNLYCRHDRNLLTLMLDCLGNNEKIQFLDKIFSYDIDNATIKSAALYLENPENKVHPCTSTIFLLSQTSDKPFIEKNLINNQQLSTRLDRFTQMQTNTIDNQLFSRDRLSTQPSVISKALMVITNLLIHIDDTSFIERAIPFIETLKLLVVNCLDMEDHDENKAIIFKNLMEIDWEVICNHKLRSEKNRDSIFFAIVYHLIFVINKLLFNSSSLDKLYFSSIDSRSSTKVSYCSSQITSDAFIKNISALIKLSRTSFPLPHNIDNIYKKIYNTTIPSRATLELNTLNNEYIKPFPAPWTGVVLVKLMRLFTNESGAIGHHQSYELYKVLFGAFVSTVKDENKTHSYTIFSKLMGFEWSQYLDSIIRNRFNYSIHTTDTADLALTLVPLMKYCYIVYSHPSALANAKIESPEHYFSASHIPSIERSTHDASSIFASPFLTNAGILKIIISVLYNAKTQKDSLSQDIKASRYPLYLLVTIDLLNTLFQIPMSTEHESVTSTEQSIAFTKHHETFKQKHFMDKLVLVSEIMVLILNITEPNYLDFERKGLSLRNALLLFIYNFSKRLSTFITYLTTNKRKIIPELFEKLSIIANSEFISTHYHDESVEIKNCIPNASKFRLLTTSNKKAHAQISHDESPNSSNHPHPKKARKV